ncbi:MAG: hypothetical protein U0350_43620 [Caldilineaceae bacterium]
MILQLQTLGQALRARFTRWLAAMALNIRQFWPWVWRGRLPALSQRATCFKLALLERRRDSQTHLSVLIAEVRQGNGRALAWRGVKRLAVTFWTHYRRLPWQFTAGAVLVGLLLIGLLLYRARMPITPVRSLTIHAPAQIQAGEPVTITVQVEPATAQDAILLLAQGTFGLYPQIQTPVQGIVHFQLTPLQTQFAGTVQWMARGGTVETRSTSTILPGPAADPILPLVGPRSIVADHEHWTMLLATPRDQFFNAVAEQSPVTFRVQHPLLPNQNPATGLEVVQTRTQHLVAWAKIYSRTHAGRTLLTANSGDAYSPERTMFETPGLPIPFALTADRLTLPADGRQLVQISSEQIMDRFGNALSDGAEVTLLADMSGQDRRSLPAVTVDGRIYTTLQAPIQPGEMTVQAWLGGVSSTPLHLTFTPGPAVLPIKMKVVLEPEQINITAGPLVGQLGQFIPDAAAVTFTFTTPDGQVTTYEALVDYGYATLTVRRATLLSGLYQVQASAGTGAGQTSFQLP